MDWFDFWSLVFLCGLLQGYWKVLVRKEGVSIAIANKLAIYWRQYYEFIENILWETKGVTVKLQWAVFIFIHGNWYGIGVDAATWFQIQKRGQNGNWRQSTGIFDCIYWFLDRLISPPDCFVSIGRWLVQHTAHEFSLFIFNIFDNKLNLQSCKLMVVCGASGRASLPRSLLCLRRSFFDFMCGTPDWLAKDDLKML